LRAERRLVRRRSSGDAGPRRVDDRRAAAARRLDLAPLRKAASQAEARIARLTEARAKVEAALADPALYAGPPEKIAELGRLKSRLDGELAAAETAWLEAQARLEAVDVT